MADSYVNVQAPLRSGELAKPIQINTNNLADMASKGAAYIEMENEKCPVKIDLAFGVKTGAEATMALNAEAMRRLSPQARPAGSRVVREIYARGTLVYDNENMKRATIIKANVGITRKGRPVHRLADSRGDVWLQSERKLKRL